MLFDCLKLQAVLWREGGDLFHLDWVLHHLAPPCLPPRDRHLPLRPLNHPPRPKRRRVRSLSVLFHGRYIRTSLVYTCVCVYHAYNYVYSIVSFVGHKYTYMYMYICTCTAHCSISGQVYTVYSTYTVYSV